MFNLQSILSNFKNKKNLFFVFVAVCIFFISNGNGMFWDNVLFASKMGNHLYDNSILNWSIPIEFDPGHPPFLGFLLAMFWKIFGHKLWVSHLLMLPFTIGVFYQLFKFITYFIKDKKSQILAFTITIVDPTLSTQFVIVNPEVLIVFFFFLAINGILFKKNNLKFIGFFFLSIVSFRSMMILAGIFLFESFNKLFIEKKGYKSIINFKYLSFYILSSLPGLIFIAWRLITKGWLQTHPNSPWASLWQIASPKIFLKNIIILIHRYSDFGRVFIFIFLIASFILFGKKIISQTKNKQLLLLAFLPVIFIIVISLLATNTFGHRYFIVSFNILTILTFSILTDYFSNRKLLYSLLLIGLITGNFWIYPKRISQGWDASLAHIPYHNLRKDAINYLDNKNINISKVASFFPNKTTIDDIDFSKNRKAFTTFTGNNKYVLYSTVYNLSDEQYNLLEKNYSVLKQFNKFNINITIYILNKT